MNARDADRIDVGNCPMCNHFPTQIIAPQHSAAAGCTFRALASPPAVPDEAVVPYGTAEKDYAYGYEKGCADGWNNCRASMLAAAPPSDAPGEGKHDCAVSKCWPETSIERTRRLEKLPPMDPSPAEQGAREDHLDTLTEVERFLRQTGYDALAGSMAKAREYFLATPADKPTADDLMLPCDADALMRVHDGLMASWIAGGKDRSEGSHGADLYDFAQTCYYAARRRRHEALTADRAAPEGMVLVPREPTEVMQSAGLDAFCNSPGIYKDADEPGIFADVYRAMLSAAAGDKGKGNG